MTRSAPTRTSLAPFFARFFALLVAFGLVQLLRPEFQEPLQVGFARLLTGCLVGLGWGGVYRSDIIVGFPGGGVAIGAECTGVALYALLVAFIFAFPASARERVAGLAIGAAILFVANVARLVSCAYVMRYRPDWFTFFHEYVWQIGLVGLTLAVIAHWARRVVD